MAARLLSLVYGIVYVLVLIPSLPVAEHGRYAIVFYAFLQITNLVKLSLLHPMIRFAAMPGRFESVVGQGFQLSVILYVAAGCAVWALASPAGQILRVDAASIRLIPLLLAVIFFREFVFCVQQVLYRTARIFVLEAIYFLVSAAGFIILSAQGALTTAVAALEVNALAALLSSAAGLLFGFGGARLLGGWNFKEIKELIRYGFYSLGVGLSGYLINGADVLFIAAIYTPVEAAIYNGAKAVYRLFSAAGQAAAMLVMPYASKLQSSAAKTELRTLYEKVAAYSWMGLAASAAASALVCGMFYGRFMNGAYSSSAPILRLMLAGAPFEGLFVLSASLLYGLGAANRVVLVSMLTVAVWFMVAAASLYVLKIPGAEGSAAGLSLAFALSAAVIFRITSVEVSTNLRAVIGRFRDNVQAMFARAL